MLTVNGRTVYMAPERGVSIPGFPDSRIIGYDDPTTTSTLVNKPVASTLDSDIVVTTVDREAVSKSPNHIRECLGPIKGRAVHLMPDCESTEYIGEQPESVEIHPWTALQMHRQRTLKKGARAAYNYCRCLTFSKRAALILEDDVVLDEDWEPKVLVALSRIPEDRFILAVHQNWDWAVRSCPGDEVTRFVSPVILHGSSNEGIITHWAGTNALYYPPGLAFEVGRIILNALNSDPESHKTAYDMLVSLWCYSSNVPVYLMTPSAARNVGMVTAIEWNTPGA